MKDDTSQTTVIYPGTNPISPEMVVFSVVTDDIVEDEECLVLLLSTNKTNINERDDGFVDLVNTVAIARIQDLSKCPGLVDNTKVVFGQS